MTTKFDGYRAALSLFDLFGDLPLEVADLVAPHLTQEDIDNIVEPVRNGETVYFAAPSLRVRNAFHVLTAVPASEASKADSHFPRPAQKAHLRWSWASRTTESYADGNLKGDVIEAMPALRQSDRLC